MTEILVNPSDLRRMAQALIDTQAQYRTLAQRLPHGLPEMPPYVASRLHGELDWTSTLLRRRADELDPVRDDLVRRAAWAEFLTGFSLVLGRLRQQSDVFPLRALLDAWRRFTARPPKVNFTPSGPITLSGPGGMLQGSSPNLQGGSSSGLQGGKKSVSVAGPGQFKNSTIASEALKHVPPQASATPARDARSASTTGDTSRGQCRQFVGWVLSAIPGLGGTHAYVYTSDNPGRDYYRPFLKLGAAEVGAPEKAIAGDVVQIGETEDDAHLHTFIVVQNDMAGRRFAVVDSNALGSASRPENHVRYYWRGYPPGEFKIFRLGQP